MVIHQEENHQHEPCLVSGEHACKADEEEQEHAAEYDRYRSSGCKDLIHA
jgi:hypothetical protein